MRWIATPFVAVVITGGLVGCDSSGSASCEEQAALAAELALDPVLGEVLPTGAPSELYTSYPCEENSGGSLVTAGRRYRVAEALTFTALEQLTTKAAPPTSWTAFARIRPEDGGSGGNSHICFKSVGEKSRYLRFHTEGEVGLVVEVSQADEEVELCPEL